MLEVLPGNSDEGTLLPVAADGNFSKSFAAGRKNANFGYWVIKRFGKGDILWLLSQTGSTIPNTNTVYLSESCIYLIFGLNLGVGLQW